MTKPRASRSSNKDRGGAAQGVSKTAHLSAKSAKSVGPSGKPKTGKTAVIPSSTTTTTKTGSTRPRVPGSVRGGPPVRSGVSDQYIPTIAECQSAFLAAYEQCGTVSGACRESRVGRATHYYWLEHDPDYKERFASSHDSMVDGAEGELRRRGVEGYDKPVYQGGELVGYIHEYSDACLIFYLKGRRPDVFRERFDPAVVGAMPVLVYVPENARQALLEQAASMVEQQQQAPVDVTTDQAPLPDIDVPAEPADAADATDPGGFIVDLSDNGR